MKQHPPVALRAFPPLSQRCALRAWGRSQRGGAALARLPGHGPRRFCGVWVTYGAMEN